MNDPQRLRDKGDPFERFLLEAARSDIGSTSALHRSMAVFIAAGAVTSVGTANAATTASWIAKSGWLLTVKWIGVGMVAGGMTVGSVFVHEALQARQSATTDIPSTVPPQQTARAPAQARSHPVPLSTSPDEVASSEVLRSRVPAPSSTSISVLRRITKVPPSVSVVPTLETRPATSVASRQAPVQSAVGVTGQRSLAEELDVLDRARRALAQGQSVNALRALNRHAARFPNGTFALEAELIRVQALVARGDMTAATALATRFLASHPSGPYADRMRSIVARSIP